MSARKTLVIGGGFFGCWISSALARRKDSVTLVERQPALMMEASLKNQARVHGGYHYPRSLPTALACRQQFPRFLKEFECCVRRPKFALYAIAKRGSLVTSGQFRHLCERIGAPLKKADSFLTALFSKNLVDSVFEVEEWVFDARILKTCLESRLCRQGVTIRLNEEVVGVRRQNGCLEFRMSSGAIEECDEIFACLYDSTNQFLMRSHFPAIPLEIESVELALVEPPTAFRDISITVMDGPFWSLMPYPNGEVSTLSHVRYTPYHRVTESSASPEPAQPGQPQRSSCAEMLRDAARFVPGLASTRQKGSILARKAILPGSAETDSRPIALIKNHAIEGLHIVIGGKLDAVFDLEKELV